MELFIPNYEYSTQILYPAFLHVRNLILIQYASVAARPALSITLRHDRTVERHTRIRTRPG